MPAAPAALNCTPGMTQVISPKSEEPVVQWATKEDVEALRAEIDALRLRKAVRKNDADE